MSDSDLRVLQDKEVEYGGAPPRVLGLDDYFMTEVEKQEKDPDTGKRVKTKVWKCSVILPKFL